MSTLFIRNGKIWINFSQNGKQIRRSLKLNAINGKIPPEAKRIQQQIEEQLALATYGLTPIAPRRHITLGQFKTELLTHSTARKAKTTAELDRYRINTLIQFFGADRPLQTIDVRAADSFISSLIPNRKPYTVNSHIRSYRAMFNLALKWNYITANPFKAVGKLPVEDPVPRVLTAQELKQLIVTVVQFPKLIDYFYFYLLTGCRLSEARQLNWSDIDWDRNTITIQRTKNHKSRVIIMAQKVRNLLLARRHLPMPFPEYANSKDELSKAFTALFRTAGVRRASLKSLRSNFSSYLAAVGMPQSINEKFLGHTELVSKRHYINFVENVVQDKIQQVEQLLTDGQDSQQHKNSTLTSDN